MNEFDLEQYLFDKAKLRGQPVRAFLELTPVCNFDCEICYVRHSRQEARAAGGTKPTKFWLDLIPRMKRMGILIVTLIGGEPLLYEGFQEVYSALLDNGFLVNVTTNGSLISDEIIQLFTEKPPRYVTVSLYGASDATYQRMTGNPHGFTMTMKGIAKMQAAGINVKLNFTVAPDNKDDFDAIYRLKEQYDLPILADTYCFPPTRRASNRNQKRLSAAESAAYYMAIKKKDPQVDYPAMCQRIASHTVSKIEALHTCRFSCYAGSASFWVNWRGGIMPCGFLEQMSIPLDTYSLEDAWERLKADVAAVHTSEKCGDCENREFCHVCPAAIYCETGGFEKAPKYLCEMTDEIIRIAEKDQ